MMTALERALKLADKFGWRHDGEEVQAIIREIWDVMGLMPIKIDAKYVAACKPIDMEEFCK